MLPHGLLQPRFASVCQVGRAKKRLMASLPATPCFLMRHFPKVIASIAARRTLHGPLDGDVATPVEALCRRLRQSTGHIVLRVHYPKQPADMRSDAPARNSVSSQT